MAGYKVQLLVDLFIYANAIKTFFSELEAERYAKEINEKGEELAVIHRERDAYICFSMPK